MKYFKPKSLTWWSGIATIAYAIIAKDYAQISVGLGLIGVRAAIN